MLMKYNLWIFCYIIIINPMKHKNNFFTRIYVIQILNVYFAQEENKYSPINKKILDSIDIKDIFEYTMEFPHAEINFELVENILNTYVEKEEFINGLREKYQERSFKSVDHMLIVIINTAIAEYLSHEISIGIIVSEYVNICSIFHDATKFVHSILDKTLNTLKKDAAINII
jgi:transcription termination factor NusB